MEIVSNLLFSLYHKIFICQGVFEKFFVDFKKNFIEKQYNIFIKYIISDGIDKPLETIAVSRGLPIYDKGENDEQIYLSVVLN